jgi:hypothetical protein
MLWLLRERDIRQPRPVCGDGGAPDVAERVQLGRGARGGWQGSQWEKHTARAETQQWHLLCSATSHTDFPNEYPTGYVCNQYAADTKVYYYTYRNTIAYGYPKRFSSAVRQRSINELRLRFSDSQRNSIPRFEPSW